MEVTPHSPHRLRCGAAASPATARAKPTARFAPLLALLALLLPATARGQDAAANHAAGAVAAAPDSNAPASARILRIATSGDYAPFSYEDPAAGASGLAGFDIEVATLFARDRGYEPQFVRFRWPDLGRELAAAGFDVAMSGVTLKPERSIAGRFCVPVAATRALAVTWKGSGATTLEELDRPARRVAVNAGGHLETVAHAAFRHAAVVAIADNDAVRMALLDRAFDAVVTDSFEEKTWTAGMRDVVRIGPLSDDRKAYLLPADRGPLAAELDGWLLAREKDGTLARLRARYFSAAVGAQPAAAPTGGEALATAEPLAALISAILERLALMPMVYDAKRVDDKPIEDKAQEAVVLDAAVRALADAATAANVPAPDAAAGRRLFETLIAMGRDAQQQIADNEARERARPAPPRAGATASAVAAATEREPAARPVASRRSYDLGSQLRPAIGRITDKIARIVAAMDEPVSARQARQAFSHALVPLHVKPERLDALAAAVVDLSTRKPPPN